MTLMAWKLTTRADGPAKGPSALSSCSSAEKVFRVRLSSDAVVYSIVGVRAYPIDRLDVFGTFVVDSAYLKICYFWTLSVRHRCTNSQFRNRSIWSSPAAAEPRCLGHTG